MAKLRLRLRRNPAKLQHKQMDSYWFDRITKFYLIHNPAKVSQVAELLQKYKEKELQLMAHLINKYGPEPRDKDDEDDEEPSIFTMKIIAAISQEEQDATLALETAAFLASRLDSK